MAAPGGEGTVRLVDVYAEQIKAVAQLAVIAEQLKMLPDHEIRIRALERWRYALPASIFLAVASGVAGIIEIILSRH